MKNTGRAVLTSALLFAAAAVGHTGGTASGIGLAQVDAIYPDIEKLYIDLHQNPELAFHEQRTAAALAARV